MNTPSSNPASSSASIRVHPRFPYLSSSSVVNISPRTARLGMTLIELLVVVSILMILTVIVLPRVQPAAETRAVREAARSVDIFLATARNEAVASGRPVGVLLRRHDTEANACTTLEQVEIPPPYAGDTDGAAIRIQDWTYTGGGAFYMPGKVVLKARIRTANMDFSDNLIRRGDLLQINGQGPVYSIVDDLVETSGDTDIPVVNGFIQFSGAGLETDNWSSRFLTLVADATSMVRSPWPYKPTGSAPDIWSNPVGFTIARQPYYNSTMNSFSAIASAVEPLELPSGTAIDLWYSGSDQEPQLSMTLNPNDRSPIILMFSPNGSLNQIFYQANQDPVTEPVFLLIGRWERAFSVDTDGDGVLEKDLPEDELMNVEDLNNYWVTVNPQSGLVTTSEMATTTYSSFPVENQVEIEDFVRQSRAFARQSRRMGGR